MDEHTALPSLPIVVVTDGCGGGTCPTIYRTASGSYLVQGRRVAASDVGIDVPADETIVEIPESLVAELIDGGRRAQ
jgi:hypothetical protein